MNCKFINKKRGGKFIALGTSLVFTVCLVVNSAINELEVFSAEKLETEYCHFCCCSKKKVVNAVVDAVVLALMIFSAFAITFLIYYIEITINPPDKQNSSTPEKNDKTNQNTDSSRNQSEQKPISGNSYSQKGSFGNKVGKFVLYTTVGAIAGVTAYSLSKLKCGKKAQELLMNDTTHSHAKRNREYFGNNEEENEKPGNLVENNEQNKTEENENEHNKNKEE